VLGGHSIFQAASVAKTSSIAIGALIALVPAVLGARIFLEVRVRFAPNMVTERSRAQLLISMLTLAIIAGVSVAVFRDAAGNGMEALRSTAETATIGLAVALAFGKLVGTTAALASGVPGGVLTPTLSIAAGFALLASFGLSALGIAPVSLWAITIAAMAVGLTVGLRAPLMAMAMVPELVGDYSLIPVIAIVVAAAWLIDRQIDRFLVHEGKRLPDGIHDEDG
jgi:H+/Cl- antiporter ClcA